MDWASIKIGKAYAIDMMNPFITSANMAIPFVVSIFEDYFRSTYIALLKYSSQKDAVLRSCRIQGEDLILLGKMEITIEEAVARSRSFQNMKRIGQSFNELDSNVDLFGTLQNSSLGAKSSYATFEKVIDFRHRIVHRAENIMDYAPKKLLNDTKTIKEGVGAFYISLIDLYGWYSGHPDL